MSVSSHDVSVLDLIAGFRSLVIERSDFITVSLVWQRRCYSVVLQRTLLTFALDCYI